MPTRLRPAAPRGPVPRPAVRSARLRRAVTAVAALAGTTAALCLVPSAPARADEPEAYLQTRLQDPRITESSGLARSGYDNRVLWTHNDSGDEARLFAVRDGATEAVVRLGGTSAYDWEAISRYRSPSGRSWLYVGDIGDNAEARSEVVVHRVAEPTDLRDQTVWPTSYRMRYEDGRHDAEALLVHPQTGRIYVVAKDGAGVYEAPETLDPEGVNVLRRVAWAPMTVTDGAFLFDGRMVLRNYTDAFVSRGPGQPQLVVRLPGTAQGESLAVAPGYQAVLIGSEGTNSPVFWQPLPSL